MCRLWALRASRLIPFSTQGYDAFPSQDRGKLCLPKPHVQRPFQLHLWCQPAEPFCNLKAKKGSDWSLPRPPSQPWLAHFKMSCLFALGIQLQNSYLHPVSQCRLLHCAMLQSQPRFLLDSLLFMIQGLSGAYQKAMKMAMGK